MTKDQKVVAIQEIKDLLQDAKVVYVADLQGLNAAKSSDFRRQAFKQNIKVKVVKNTLLQKAMEQIEGVDYAEMFETFKGNSALMIAETANAPAKLIKEFKKAQGQNLKFTTAELNNAYVAKVPDADRLRNIHLEYSIGSGKSGKEGIVLVYGIEP